MKNTVTWLFLLVLLLGANSACAQKLSLQGCSKPTRERICKFLLTCKTSHAGKDSSHYYVYFDTVSTLAFIHRIELQAGAITFFSHAQDSVSLAVPIVALEINQMGLITWAYTQNKIDGALLKHIDSDPKHNTSKVKPYTRADVEMYKKEIMGLCKHRGIIYN